MKKFLYILAALVSLGIAGHNARAGEQKDVLEDRVHTLNSMADKRGDFKMALHDVSVETGVPMDKLQQMHNQHPDAGAGGIMVACVLADDTKKPAEHFLSSHVNGKGWAEIARQNSVPLDRINGRLDRLEHDFSLKPTGRDTSRHY